MYGLEFINRFSEEVNSSEISDRNKTYAQSVELIEIESINDEFTVVDLGANYGEFIKALAPTGCKIYAFEPHPVFYEIISNEYEETENVILSNNAMWIQNEKRKFYFKRSKESLNGGATLMEEKTNILNKNLNVEVQCLDICDFIDSVGYVDILKVDVEGAEYELLDRLYESGRHEKVGSIYFEDHERKMPSQRFRQLKQKVIKNYNSINKNLYWW